MAGNNYDVTLLPGTLTVTLCGGEIIGLNGITIGASSALVDSYNSSIGYRDTRPVRPLCSATARSLCKGPKSTAI